MRLLAGQFYNLALAESAAARLLDAKAHFQRALALLAGPSYASQTLRRNILDSDADFLSHAGRKKEARKAKREASNVERVIRQDSYADYVADVSSFR